MTDRRSFVGTLPVLAASATPWLGAMSLGPCRDVREFGAVGDGRTDDTEALQRAVTSAQLICFPPGSYRISSPLVLTRHSQALLGVTKGQVGRSSVEIVAASDIEFFQVRADYVLFQGLTMRCAGGAHSKRHLQTYDVTHLQVIDCRFDGLSGAGVGSGIGLGNGQGGIGGSMAIIDRCIVAHGSIDVFTSDVKITNSYVWSLSRPYGIKVVGGVGNLQCFGVDVVPPLADVSDRKAGIFLTGPSVLCKFVGCYIDGSGQLATGVGLLAEDGVIGLHIDGLTADSCKEHVIVLDSIVAPTVRYCTFLNNNLAGNAAADILLRNTFGQSMDRCTIVGNTHMMTRAGRGVPGAAIRVAHTTGRRGLRIMNNFVVRPSPGAGYSEPAIILDDGPFRSESEGLLTGNSDIS